jgi:hypothetical protein
MKRYFAVLGAAALVAACDGDSSGPSLLQQDVMGTYTLTALSVDPQGSLPATNLLPLLDNGSIPELRLLAGGDAQLVFENSNGQLVVANASYTTAGSNLVRIDFGSDNNTLYQDILFSERMTFMFDDAANTLTFSGTAPDGIDRDRLIQIVPDWADEQLPANVLGVLTATFTAGAAV